MRSNFKYRPNTGFPDIDDSIFTSSATQRIDNVNFNTGDNSTTFKFMGDFSDLVKSSN